MTIHLYLMGTVCRGSALLILAFASSAHADAVLRLDVEQAAAYALRHHPALQAADALTQVRGSQVDVARSGYLPRLDLSLQINAGTGNVLRGPSYPLRGIPTVSGPPTGRSFGDASFGTSVGVGASWDALGLPQQMAAVDAALAEQAQALASIRARSLTVAYAAADQFIDVLGRGETVRAARANVERCTALATIVKALVDQQLRPGVEYARASAELALASTQLIRAQQADTISRAELANALGVAGMQIELIPGALLGRSTLEVVTAVGKHPLVAEADATVRAAWAHKHAVDLQYLPRLDLVGSLWVRGSGLTSGALAPSPAAGIVPDTPNWAAGIVLAWPALELIAVRARTRVEAAQIKVADARRSEVAQAIRTQIDGARTMLDGAHKVADNTPVALRAAGDAEKQATARYRAGLANVAEVADAQRLLAQAEIDDAVARLNVHRAYLLLARAVGDVEPFFQELRTGSR